MLCNLALRLTEDGGYMLRVSGKTALGPSGTGGKDTKSYASVEAMFRGLEPFRPAPTAISAAVRAINDNRTQTRFITFAEEVQVSFETIEHADFYLFD